MAEPCFFITKYDIYFLAEMYIPETCDQYTLILDFAPFTRVFQPLKQGKVIEMFGLIFFYKSNATRFSKVLETQIFFHV